MKKSLTTLLLFVVIFASSFFIYRQVRALVPFGGAITFVRVCECPVPGLMIRVSPPVGGVFLYTPSTVLYPNGNIVTLGTWILGLHNGTPVGCGNFEKGLCANQTPTEGIMYMVGTS